MERQKDIYEMTSKAGIFTQKSAAVKFSYLPQAKAPAGKMDAKPSPARLKATKLRLDIKKQTKTASTKKIYYRSAL